MSRSLIACKDLPAMSNTHVRTQQEQEHAPTQAAAATSAPSLSANPGVDAQGYQDCMSCRVMGGATFIGLGIYSLTIPIERPSRSPSSSLSSAQTVTEAARNSMRRLAPQLRGGVGLAFIALGVYRLAS